MFQAVIVGVLLALVTADPINDGVADYTGYKVIRLETNSDSARDFMRRLERAEFHLDSVDVWSHNDIMIHKSELPILTDLLQRRGLAYSLMINDVQEAIKDQLSGSGQAKSAGDTRFTLEQYNSFEEILNYMDQLAMANSFVSIEQYGESFEGRPLRVLKIDTTGSSEKQAVWIDCGSHAREWVSHSTCIWMMTQLIEGYGVNSVETDLVNNLVWYFVPVMNPDGYVYTHEKDRMWRKTRSDNPGSPCKGTDPNRNWDYEWLGEGSSGIPCSGTYRGSASFSEVEMKSVSEYMTASTSQIALSITFHAYSQLWMLPWSYTETRPDDYDDLMRVGNVAVSALTAVHGTIYELGTIPEIIYIASGSETDWVKAVLGVKYSYAVELRDKGRYGFLLPEDQIKPTGEETWAAVRAMAVDMFL